MVISWAERTENAQFVLSAKCDHSNAIQCKQDCTQEVKRELRPGRKGRRSERGFIGLERSWRDPEKGFGPREPLMSRKAMLSQRRFCHTVLKGGETTGYSGRTVSQTPGGKMQIREGEEKERDR